MFALSAVDPRLDDRRADQATSSCTALVYVFFVLDLLLALLVAAHLRPARAGDQRVDERALQRGEPVVDRQLLVLLRRDRRRRLGVLGDVEPGAQRQPQVVDGAQPRAGLVGVQPDLSPAVRAGVARTMARSSALPLRSDDSVSSR